MIAIRDIKEVDRRRVDYGDLAGLAASMRDIGQLQPIVVTPDLRLVAGGRRLAAARSLGWMEIEAKVANDLTDATLLLRAEGDENTCRKSFTPTEEHALYEALLQLDQSIKMKTTTKAKGSKSAGTGDTIAHPSARTKASIAQLITGTGGRFKSFEKIGEIKQLASDKKRSDRLRTAAQEALQEIDRTGNISGAHTRVMLAKKAEAARNSADPATWSEEEKRIYETLQQGRTVVVSLRSNHANVVRWARAEGHLVEVDRTSEWGNPFEMPYDGDRDTVIKNYAEHYLPYKPSLLDNVRELRGKALACWCAPDACHADVLVQFIEDGPR
jgi:ParB-like chromosome segregation protein Spo0J